MKPNNLASPDVYNQATTGQYGIVKLLTGEVSNPKLKFVAIKAGVNDSSFTCDLGGIGDKTFTWNLDKGDYISGPFSNIRNVNGELACFPTK